MPRKLAFEFVSTKVQNQPAVQELQRIIEKERGNKSMVKEAMEYRFHRELEVAGDNNVKQHQAERRYIEARREEAGWDFDTLMLRIRTIRAKFSLSIITEAQRVDIDDADGDTILRIYIGEARFKVVSSGPEQSVFKARGSDKAYVLDDAGERLSRYVLRFITHEERNRLAARNGYILTGTESRPEDRVLVPRHMGLNPTQHELTQYDITSEPTEPLTRRQHEFLLNRTGTQRLLPITKTRHPLRSNKFFPFVEFGDLYYLHKARPGSNAPDTYGLGGGMVLLDLAELPSSAIRAQYSGKAVKEYEGFGRKKVEERQSTERSHELERAEISAIRNREIHIGPDVPDSAIIAWSPGPHEDRWRPLRDVSPTLESLHAPSTTFYTDTRQPAVTLHRSIQLPWGMAMGLKSTFGHPTREALTDPVSLTPNEQIFFDYLVKNRGLKFADLSKKDRITKALNISYEEASAAYESLIKMGAVEGDTKTRRAMPKRRPR
ncbi:hypothetical protein D7V80_32335 [Corallococcus sp. CA054B]|uniref:hypothetical protein n=1 Tax=Corallococcus sp. CA054B TaxID=2316734 RepID=UPI000EA2A523|nr:hypothetical protein [Corallococcus sp. CA054B]RKG62987.1 hypothetical protein D7V80_32335 [Corallococcus sp. CA054B]